MKHVLFSLLPLWAIAQVGINTTNPQGALDVQSTNMGFLPPRIALNNITDNHSLINPTGGLLAVGTIVYNTANTPNLEPAPYFWNGASWVKMCPDTQYEYKKQSHDNNTNAQTFLTINNLRMDFIPKTSGRYHIRLKIYMSVSEPLGSNQIGIGKGTLSINIGSTSLVSLPIHAKSVKGQDGLLYQYTLDHNIEMTKGIGSTFTARFTPESYTNVFFMKISEGMLEVWRVE